MVTPARLTSPVSFLSVPSLTVPLIARYSVSAQCDSSPSCAQVEFISNAVVSRCYLRGVILWAAGQNMTGTLPVEVTYHPFLQSLSLQYNDFSGSIPVEYARMMHYLINLDVHGNQLSGSIPNDIYENNILELIILGENHLTGTISTLIGQLTPLKGLHVDHNRLEGSTPEEIGKLPARLTSPISLLSRCLPLHFR
jgi:Leucine-rich repeat (LRR) protein